MARICKRCGRPLDETGHDIEKLKESRPAPHGSRQRRKYGCRVRLVGRSPTSGRRITPREPQREKALGLPGYVLIDNLDRES